MLNGLADNRMNINNESMIRPPSKLEVFVEAFIWIAIGKLQGVQKEIFKKNVLIKMDLLKNIYI